MPHPWNNVSCNPNVRVEAGPAARRQARAGENVPVPPAQAWRLAAGPRLERGVRRHWDRRDVRVNLIRPGILLE